MKGVRGAGKPEDVIARTYSRHICLPPVERPLWKGLELLMSPSIPP